ncbi:MAG: hypothetical protein KOO69_02235 [Victivallales bacterium]|nr:hypothetical protein [Victivallales bacterium]
MKKMLILLSAIILFASACSNKSQAENLIDYVPADANGIIAIDAERLINLPFLKSQRENNAEFDNGWKKFESELKDYGLTTNDLPSKAVVFFKVDAGTQNAAILAITKITEAKLISLLKANSKTVSFVEKTIAERKAYVITHKDKKNDQVLITYIKTNLVLICDDDKAEQFCKSVGKIKNTRLIAANKKADPKALLNIIYTKEAKTAPPAAPAPGMPPVGGLTDSITSAVIALNLIGKEQKDINLKADLEYTDPQAASQMAMQLKTGVMIMTMQFAKDATLSKSVTEAIKINQKDKNIKINISISESLLEKIKTTMEGNKKQVLAKRTAPVKLSPKQVSK